MLAKTFKFLVCGCFVLILTVKTMVPVAAVFVNHFAKQIKTSVLVADQDDDDKAADGKEFGKIIKLTDEFFTHSFVFAPFVAAVNLRYKQQNQLFKQTHFPAVATPPPNA